MPIRSIAHFAGCLTLHRWGSGIDRQQGIVRYGIPKSYNEARLQFATSLQVVTNYTPQMTFKVVSVRNLCTNVSKWCSTVTKGDQINLIIDTIKTNGYLTTFN